MSGEERFLLLPNDLFPPSVIFYINLFLLVQNSPKLFFSNFLFFSFYFNNILVVLSHIWHIFAIIRSFFFILLLLLLSMLRL